MTRTNWDPESEDAKPYFDFARDQNSLQHSSKRGDKASCTLAKAVLTFDTDSSDMHWRLRTHTATAQQQVTTSLVALMPPAGLLCAQGPAAEPSRLIPAWTETKASLTGAVDDLVTLYEELHNAGDQKTMLRTLHRLQIYMTGLTLDIDAAPHPIDGAAGAAGASCTEHRSEQARARRLYLDADTVDAYVAFFEEVQAHLVAAQGAPLPPGDTAAILLQLKDITRFFRRASLSLPDICVKLATKPSTHTQTRAALIARLTTLTDDGLQRLSRQTPQAAVHQFICAFVHASRFWGGAVGRTQDSALADVVHRLVCQLCAIESPGHYPLLALLKHLLMRVLEQQDESLAYTLEMLLRDEACQTYLAGVVNTDEAAFVDAALKTLLRSPHQALWQASVPVFLLRPREACTAALEEGVAVGGAGPLAPERLNAIFDAITAQLAPFRSADGAGFYTAESMPMQARYQDMMRVLARANALSLLAEHPRSALQQRQVADIFSAMHPGLPLDDLRLSSLFSNAAYWARAYAQQRTPGAVSATLSNPFFRAISKLLQQTHASPVHDVALFNAQLDLLARSYSRGPVALRGLILKALGEVSRPGLLAADAQEASQLRSVEAWLRDTVIPDADQIMRFVLGCYPFIWRRETFASPQMLAERVVISSAGQLHLTAFVRGEMRLGDIASLSRQHTVPIDHQLRWYSATPWSALCESIRPIGQRPAIKQSIAAMVHHVYAFNRLRLSADKTARIHALLSAVQAPLAAEIASEAFWGLDERTPGSLVAAFQDRMETLNVVLRSVAPFAQVHLEDEATKRFFRRGELTVNGRRFIAADPRVDSLAYADHLAAVVDRLFDVGFSVVENLASRQLSQAALRQSVKQIDGKVAREMDMQSFSTALMVASFNTRHQRAEHKRTRMQLDADEVEALRQRLYLDAATTLTDAQIPYIMPNQAIAVALCRHRSLLNAHVLLKMGTGQGKSFVIAATALQEALTSPSDNTAFVFVLTGFDHLARGDHQTGQKFFAAQQVKSACLVNVHDLDKLESDTKIIYASARTLQVIVQVALTRQILHTLDPSRPKWHRSDAFLQKLFAGAHRFILDEYDLVLNDLDFSRGTVSLFSNAVLDRSFVTAEDNCAYAPSLQKLEVAQADVSYDVTDKADGYQGNNTTTPYLQTTDGPAYRLRNGGLRVAALLQGAKRIIGLSGTSHGDTFADVPELEGKTAAYFELPSSRDPDAFGTRVMHRKEDLDGLPGAWRTTHLELAAGAQAQYIRAIVQEVRTVRTPCAAAGEAGVTLRRPILIFVDPAQKELFEALRGALEQEVGDHLKVKLDDAQIQGASLQEMGLAGQVTLVTLNCGRGVDIRVSLDIPDSLHVVVATDVPSERLLTQIIGRTARNCRNGSYATITMGPCVTTSARKDRRADELMLHEMTRDLVANLNAAEPQWGAHRTGPTYMRRWLMLASEVQWGSSAVGEALRGCFVAPAVAS